MKLHKTHAVQPELTLVGVGRCAVLYSKMYWTYVPVGPPYPGS